MPRTRSSRSALRLSRRAARAQPARVVVDDPRLDVADLGPHGQAVEDEVAQRVGVGDADVEQEVVGARDVEQLDHLRHREGRLAERVDVRPRVGADPHGHDRLEPTAEASRSTSAWKPRGPAGAQGATRSRQVDGARPTRAARSLFEIRASSCRAATRARSIRSRRSFGIDSEDNAAHLHVDEEAATITPWKWTPLPSMPGARISARSAYTRRRSISRAPTPCPTSTRPSTALDASRRAGPRRRTRSTRASTTRPCGVSRRGWPSSRAPRTASRSPPGMAALTACLLAACSERRHVVALRPLYGGSDHLLACGLLGIDVTWAEAADVADAIRPETGLVLLETPQNPTLGQVDIAAVVAAAGGVPVLVDNTFATPILQNPARHGAALTLHSATKFLGGHGDVVAGAVACDADWAGRLRQVRILTGALLHPSPPTCSTAACRRSPAGARGAGARPGARRAARRPPGGRAGALPRGRRRPAPRAWRRARIRGGRRQGRSRDHDGVRAARHARGQPRINRLPDPAPRRPHPPAGRPGREGGRRRHATGCCGSASGSRTSTTCGSTSRRRSTGCSCRCSPGCADTPSDVASLGDVPSGASRSIGAWQR